MIYIYIFLSPQDAIFLPHMLLNFLDEDESLEKLDTELLKKISSLFHSSTTIFLKCLGFYLKETKPMR
jgi:hypothetical protein